MVSSDKPTRDGIVDLLARTAHAVTACPDARTALAGGRLEEHSLIIPDLRFLDPAGLCLFYALRTAERTASVPFVFLLHPQDLLPADWGMPRMPDRVQSMPCTATHLVYVIDELLQWHQEVHRRAAGKHQNHEVAGSLSAFSVVEIVQLLQQSKKTGTVSFHSSRAAGEIGLVRGEVHHARLGPIEGAEAFYLLLAVRDGVSRFEPGWRPERRTVEQHLTNPLLEGLRQMDETQSIISEIEKRAKGRESRRPPGQPSPEK